VDKNSNNIRLRSLLNFRDAGGLRLASGGKMKTGLVYRSANPDRISKKDIVSLKEIGIKTIIDLRGPSEFKKRKAIIPGVKIINLPLDFREVTHQKIRPLIKLRYDPEEIDRIINGLYIDIIDASRGVLGKVASLILEPGYVPLLIHCQAGKDRTGIISAMLQMIAGAEREEIIRDYMASNDVLVPYFAKKLRIRKILTLGLFPSEAVLHAVRQKNRDIETVLGRIEIHYGGIENYLSGSGFDITNLDLLKKLLTEY